MLHKEHSHGFIVRIRIYKIRGFSGVSSECTSYESTLNARMAFQINGIQVSVWHEPGASPPQIADLGTPVGKYLLELVFNPLIVVVGIVDQAFFDVKTEV